MTLGLLRGGKFARVAIAAGTCIGVMAGIESGSAGSTTPSTFTFALPSQPISLDITKNYTVQTMQIMTLVTEPLERITQSGGLTPNLATSVTQPNDTTIVYNIRPGLKFSDGNPLTAADVAWSINYTAAAGAQTASSVASVKSATVSGPNQVTVDLTYPDPLARKNIDMLTFVQESAFAKAHQSDLGSPGAVPIGTGPYVVTSDTTQSIVLTSNPTYWGQKPSVGTLVFNYISTDSSAQLALQSGSIQGYQIINPKIASTFQSVSGTHLYSVPSLSSTAISMDVDQAPFNNIHVRKAIAYAIDTKGLNKAAFGNYGGLLKSVMPVGSISDVAPSVSAAAKFLNSLPQYNFSLSKARAQLAESPYPHGFSATLPYNTSFPWAELVALNLAQNLKSLGIKITVKPETNTQWLTANFSGKHQGMQTFFGQTLPPDPDGLLNLMVGKAQEADGVNFANFTNPAIETALSQMTMQTVDAVRWQGTKTILTQMADQVPYIPLFDPPEVFAVGGGFKVSGPLTLASLCSGEWAWQLVAS
jgi:peptide/nickel transport system substrate-binding protein